MHMLRLFTGRGQGLADATARFAHGASRYALVPALMVALVVPSTARPARLHTRLVRSEPAKDATVAAPSAIRLWFSERVELSLTGLTLTGPERVMRTVRATRSDAPDAPVVVALAEPLPPGAYVVAWRTASRDGHPVRGTFRFVVTGAR